MKGTCMLKNNFNEFMLNKLLNNRSIDPITKCWNYTGNLNSYNYGRISYNKKHYMVHRIVAYLCLGFDLDSELYICHKCDNTRCFNPVHLFAGDGYDNMRDCARKDRINKWKKELTHCVNGHEFSKENTYIDPKGHRYCRECTYRRKQEYRAREIKKYGRYYH